MVRIFRVYYPVRTLVLLGGDALALVLSFVAAVTLQYREESILELQYNFGFTKILILAAATLLLAHYLDLYSPDELTSINEAYVRLYALLGAISIALAILGFIWPEAIIGNNTFFYGTVFATATLSLWRAGFTWILSKSFMRERVYVLGDGDRARRLVETLRKRPDLGMEIVGWSGALGGNGSLSRETLAETLTSLQAKSAIDTVIVALADRRGTIPTRELLDLRLSGIRVEEATTLLEKTSGTIDLEALHPSWLIFSDGFRINYSMLLARRVLSLTASLVLLLLVSPLLPLIALAIRLTSPGAVFYRQRRVGLHGRTFNVVKFRTMRQDAEKGQAVWADRNDPRVTSVGRILRKFRLDELPQLWNVLTGDMGFVGPRPERPEFVELLAQEIPYYGLRHVIRPGLTGWAQVRYNYANTIDDSRLKLQYDLFYIKNLSIGLDLLILFETAKTVLLRRGAH
jgi:sugar transferase (PEP-CTERM system associated)